MIVADFRAGKWAVPGAYFENAEYKRTETKFLLPHTGGAVCEVCGVALEAWWESTHVPSFELVKRPDRKPV